MKVQSTLIFAVLLTTGFLGSFAAPAAEPQSRYWHSFSGNGNEAAGASRLFVFGGDSGSPEYKNLNDLWYYRVDTDSGPSRRPGGRSPALVTVLAGRVVAGSVWLSAAGLSGRRRKRGPIGVSGGMVAAELPA